jgi:hypothetical protein
MRLDEFPQSEGFDEMGYGGHKKCPVNMR